MTKNNNTKYHNGIASNDIYLSKIKNNGLFFRIWGGGVLLLLTLLFSSASLATIFTAKPGELITLKTSVSAEISSSVQTIGSDASTTCYLAGFSRIGNTKKMAGTVFKKTIDGYTGFVHDGGMLIMITGGSVSTRVSNPTGHGPKYVIFSPSGEPSAPAGFETDSGRYCWTITGTSSTRGEPFYVNKLEIKAYIPKNVAPGNYPLPPLVTGSAVTGSNVSLLSSADSIEVVAPLACTISAPPTIDFGIIHGLGAKENSFLAQKTGELTVNCTDGSQDMVANAKVQVLGDALSEYNYILPLKNDNGELAPGEIRGWLNQAATNTCSGGPGTTNGLIFGDSSKWFDAGTLKLGTNTIPYVFNLCGSGSNKLNNLGPASATATINISWD